jgi:hypothetical protein
MNRKQRIQSLVAFHVGLLVALACIISPRN